MITFSDSIVEEEKSEITQILPQWETYVLQVQKSVDEDPEVESLHFLVAANSRDEFKQWLTLFEEKTKTKYTVRASRLGLGKRVIMRQTLVCQHKTHCKRIHDPTVHKVTKNTNCPSKILVTIYAVKHENYRYRGKFLGVEKIYRLMPCEVKLTLNHNHCIGNAASLRFRKPSPEIQEALKVMFELGHSPASALKCIKADLLLNCPDFPLVLEDRSKCPDYNYCYYLYTKLFKKKYGGMEFNKEGNEILQPTMQENTAELESDCSEMDMQEDNHETEEEMVDTTLVQNISREKNNELIDRAVAHLTELSNRAPDEMRKGLEALCEVEKKKTPSACTSLLLKLREENSRKNNDIYIPVQPTAISRRKQKLAGRRSNLKGRSRTAFILSSSANHTRKDNIGGCGMSKDVLCIDLEEINQ